MDSLDLIAEARAAGLTLLAEGDKLVVRGPKSADALAKQLMEKRDDILVCLAAEQVPRLPGRWRMRTAQRRHGAVTLLERIDLPQQFAWLNDVDFGDLPEPWRD